MAAIQLSFSLRTTSNVKQVHLIGSWDGYQGQLPLSRESGSSKWKGTFRFQQTYMQPGQRYWFYYMLDGYQVSHDPSKEFTVEPTTGRNLNILDVPLSASSGSSKRHSSSSHNASKRSSRRYSREIPRGRPADEIRSPKPVRPGHVAKQLEAAARTQATLDALTKRLGRTQLSDYDETDSDIEDESDESSDGDSDVPSLSSGGSSVSSCSSPSSLSSASSNCTCERYGITRAGERVKLDCGGSRCGYEEEESNEEEDESEEEDYKHRVRRSHHGSRRRHGVVIR